MPWKEQDSMSLKRQFIQKLLTKSHNISELCREFQISRVTAYKWIDRYEEEGWNGLIDLPKRPYSSPNKTKDRNVDLILKTRDSNPAWGGRKLRKVLLNEGYLDIPSEATFNRILKTHDKIDFGESNKRKKMIRFEHSNPNDLLQMDFKGHFQMQVGRCHPLTILDDHSRFALCLKGYENEETSNIFVALEEVFTEYGLPLRMTMDNGPQWRIASKLSIWLMRHGIDVSHSRPYHPQTQGKVERFHRTLKEELLKYRQFKDMDHAQQEFDEWKDLYNFKRPHEGINLLCPGDRYVKSPRKFNKTLRPIEYRSDDIVRKVRSCGQVSYKTENYFVGEYLKGEFVALRQVKENELAIIYVNSRVGRIKLI